MAKTQSPLSKDEQESANQKESLLPLLKIIWFSCVFFLALFSFYAWKFFITETAPHPVPAYVVIIFYLLGATTYGFAELMIQRKRSPASKVPPDFLQMIAYSLFEAVGLYGLILAVLTQSFFQSLVFLLAGFIGLLRHPPRAS